MILILSSSFPKGYLTTQRCSHCTHCCLWLNSLNKDGNSSNAGNVYHYRLCIRPYHRLICLLRAT